MIQPTNFGSDQNTIVIIYKLLHGSGRKKNYIMVSVNRFFKVLVFVLLICFVCVFIGSIDIIRSQTIGTTNDTNRVLLWGLTFLLISLLLVCKIYRWLDKQTEKSCFIFSLVMLGLTAAIMVTVSFCARVVQFSDSYDVLDTAFYLRQNVVASEDLLYLKFVGSFGNNFPVILLESFIIKVLLLLGIQNCVGVVTHFNVVLLFSAVVLTWLIVKETRGMRAAAKTAVVCLLNPYFYLIVNWTYSMTFSLPIMMGILYVAVRLKKAEKRWITILLALTEGALLGVGYLIRPTSVFPLIAAGLVWIPSIKKQRINKKVIIQILCILLAIILVFLFVNYQINKHFGKIKHLNLPLSFWLMMGSHGDGIWNGEDLEAMLEIEDKAEKRQYALDQTKQNYESLGIDGILNLWNKKQVTTWADGSFFIREPSMSEGNAFSEYVLGFGSRNQLTMVNSRAFRMLSILGVLLACVFVLSRQKIPEITMIMLITIFGGVVFHSVWEANARYSIPFILPMLIVMEYGITAMQEYVGKHISLNNSQKRTLGLALTCFLAVVCSNLNILLLEERPINTYSVVSTANTRLCDAINPYNAYQLDQDFYGEKPFNTLFIKATLPEEKTKEECSGYDLSINNDEGISLFSTHISPEQVSGKGIKVSFDTISGYNHYHVKLRKTEPEKDPILFYTHYSYGVDEYRGVLTVDEGTAYTNDIMMDVYDAETTTIYSDAMRIALIVLILLLGVVIGFVPIKKNDKALFC